MNVKKSLKHFGEIIEVSCGGINKISCLIRSPNMDVTINRRSHDGKSKVNIFST